MLLVDCLPPASGLVAWDSVVQLAGELALVLTPEANERFVQTVERSRCRKRLPEATGDWLALFRAIGSRDARSASDIATKLLTRQDLTVVQREYALLAAIAGHLGSDRRGRAQQVIFANTRNLRPEFRYSPWYRFLLEVTME
jgi:hypothetical protein